jgi:hypothetical protein
MTNEEVAASWVQGLMGDWLLLEQLSSPTMRIWHSHDNQWLTREEGAARIAESAATNEPVQFRDIRATPTKDGFLVQGWIEGLGGGAKTHIVQICSVEGDQVSSCEEYVAPEMSIG